MSSRCGASTVPAQEATEQPEETVSVSCSNSDALRSVTPLHTASMRRRHCRVLFVSSPSVHPPLLASALHCTQCASILRDLLAAAVESQRRVAGDGSNRTSAKPVHARESSRIPSLSHLTSPHLSATMDATQDASRRSHASVRHTGAHARRTLQCHCGQTMRCDATRPAAAQ